MGRGTRTTSEAFSLRSLFLRLACLALCLGGLLASAPLDASLYKKGFGFRLFRRHLGMTLDLDISKTYFSTYYDFAIRRPPKRRTVGGKGKRGHSLRRELRFYAYQFRKTLFPKFFLIEASFYPLTQLGATVKKHSRSDYDSLDWDVGDTSVNVLELAASRFEVPYSFSLFVGEIMPFFSEFKMLRKKRLPGGRVEKERFKKTMQSGSSIMGHVFTIGDKGHIFLTTQRNHWFQYSYKIKGTDKSPSATKKWAFELGYQNNGNAQFFDGVTFRLLRDFASNKKGARSFFHNFKIEYQAHLLTDLSSASEKGRSGIEKYTSFQKLILGRNFLLGKLVLTLEAGIKWQLFKGGASVAAQASELSSKRYFSDTTFILAPSLEF